MSVESKQPNSPLSDNQSIHYTTVPELRNFLGRHTPEERSLLRENIQEAGRWSQTAYVFQTESGLVLGNGFEPCEICQELGLPFHTELYDDEVWTIPAIQIWMIRNQLGRQHYGPTLTAFYRGYDYVISVGQRGGDQTKDRINYAEVLAKVYGVGVRTIQDNAALARHVLSLTKMVRDAFCQREFKISGQDVDCLVELTPDEQESVILSLRRDNSLSVKKAIEERDPPSQGTDAGDSKVPKTPADPVPPPAISDGDETVGNANRTSDSEADTGELAGEEKEGSNEIPTADTVAFSEAEAATQLRAFVEKLFNEYWREECEDDIAEAVAAALETVTNEWHLKNGFFRQEKFNAQ